MAAEAGNADGVTFLLNQGADKTTKDWVSPHEADPSPISNLGCTRFDGMGVVHVATGVASLSIRSKNYGTYYALPHLYSSFSFKKGAEAASCGWRRVASVHPPKMPESILVIGPIQCSGVLTPSQLNSGRPRVIRPDEFVVFWNRLGYLFR